MMKLTATIEIPQPLADRLMARPDIAAADHHELAVIWLDETLTDALAARIAGEDEGPLYEEVRQQIDMSIHLAE